MAGVTWAYLIEPNLLFVRKVDYRVPQWKGKGTPVKVVIAGDLHLMPTAFDEVRALRYVQRIMRLRPDLILLVGDYAGEAAKTPSMESATAARLLKGLTAPCGVFAIQGNRGDSTFGWNNWSRELKQARITVLEDQSGLVTFKDEQAASAFRNIGYDAQSQKTAAQTPVAGHPPFPLSHRPETDHILSHGDVDIVISGHTHGGQVCPPFGLLH